VLTLEGYADRPDVEHLPRGDVSPTDHSLPRIHLELDAETTITAIWEQQFE